MGNDERCRVHERMALKRSAPEFFIENDFYSAFHVIHKPKYCNRARRYAKEFLQAFGRTKAQFGNFEHILQFFQVRVFVMPHDHEKMPLPIFIPQKKIFGGMAGHIWRKLFRFLTGKNRRVVKALIGNSVGLEELIDIHGKEYSKSAIIKGFMALERKHNLADLYASFEGRCPALAASSVQKIDLKLDRNLLAGFVTADMPKIAKDYDAIHKGDAENVVRNGQLLDGESRLFHRKTLPASPLFEFHVARKFMRIHDDATDDPGTYPPHPPGEEIGGYRLDQRTAQMAPHEWGLNDRLVLDEYRDQGFGSVLMAAVESFVQNRADLAAAPQKLTANVAQPSVLLLFLNKGFVAQSEEDQKRIDMVLSADPSLELDYAVVKRENGKWEPQKYKDLYIFQKGTDLKSEVNAFRINLEKKFSPKKSLVDEHVENTRRQF